MLRCGVYLEETRTVDGGSLHDSCTLTVIDMSS